MKIIDYSGLTLPKIKRLVCKAGRVISIDMLNK